MTGNTEDGSAVRELLLEYARRMYESDMRGAWELRSDQAISLVPDVRNPLGQEESLDMFSKYAETHELRAIRPPTIHEVIVSGDLAYVRLTYCTEWLPRSGEGEAPAVFSRHSYILQQQAGRSWRITHDTWSNIPYDEGDVP
jgi:ketosteroid isomerase-like protein